MSLATIACLLACVLAACASSPRLADTWPGSHLVVLAKATGEALVIEPSDGSVRDRHETGSGPHEVAVSRTGEVAVVCNYGDGASAGHTLTVIDLVNRRVESLVDLAPHQRPHGIRFLDRRSTVLVTSETSRAVLEVDLASGKVVRTIPTGAEGSHMLALSPDGTRAYTANVVSGSVSVLDLESGTWVRTIPTGPQAEALDVAPDGSVWVGHNASGRVVVIDPVSLESKAVIEGLGFPIRLDVTPDGAHTIVSNAAAGELVVIDAHTYAIVARIELPRLDPVPAGTPPGFTPGSPVPVGLVIDPDSKLAFVSLAAADQVAVVDLVERRVRGQIDVPGGPDGLAWAFRRRVPGFGSDHAP